MSEHELPRVDLSPEEIEYLQNLMNQERASWFDHLLDIEEEGVGEEELEYAKARYQFTRVLRDKVYHLNGRDTLAPGKHEQRWWDQRHGY